jgi:hypothetical protein
MRLSQRLTVSLLNKHLLLLMAACLIGSGCSRKHAQPENPTTDQPKASTSVESLLGNGAVPESPPAATSPASSDAPSSAPAAAATNAIDLAAINLALKKFAREKNRVPPNLNILVEAGYLPKVPEPPLGKRFAIDPKKVEVRIEGYALGM